MDRRQRKTRDAIFKAFSLLLEHRRYENITVQDIIEKANIGRSTFYAHFETKDTLLKSMCNDIFDHIFAEQECAYPSDKTDLETKLAHILWHLREHKSDLMGILASESSDLFLGYLKEFLTVLFQKYSASFHSDVPPDFLLNHLVGGFAEVIRWWVRNDMQPSPEETARYFIAVIETH